MLSPASLVLVCPLPSPRDLETARLEHLHDEPDHPRTNQDYVTIRNGGLEELPHPVKAGKGQRMIFLHTSRETLLEAKTVHDLVVHREERQRLPRSLRERAVSGQPCRANRPDRDGNPQGLIALLGIKEFQANDDRDAFVHDDR
jgi:hypothetical protein